ncbi:hypothetical protein OAF54_02885, partial [bacterium]|nr:hypothetical protein [bacterium]
MADINSSINIDTTAAVRNLQRFGTELGQVDLKTLKVVKANEQLRNASAAEAKELKILRGALIVATRQLTLMDAAGRKLILTQERSDKGFKTTSARIDQNASSMERVAAQAAKASQQLRELAASQGAVAASFRGGFKFGPEPVKGQVGGKVEEGPAQFLTPEINPQTVRLLREANAARERAAVLLKAGVGSAQGRLALAEKERTVAASLEKIAAIHLRDQ